jgi:two-component system chemotaxis sensor kinase CheA
MLPFSTTLDVFPRMVRNIAREQGKEVDLQLEGGTVEIDRRILEEMKDPLIHLLRNSVDHGLETPEQRQASGKPRCGTLRVDVSQLDSNTVQILVADDGRGIEVEKVKNDAVDRGHLSRKEADELTDEEAFDIIFQSGVSTSPIVTELSGRGLGMAIVREKVENLGGMVKLESEAGAGMICRIELPVTLANSQGLLIRAGGKHYVLPITQVGLVMRLHRDEVQRVEGHDTIPLEGRAVSMADLAGLLGGAQEENLAEEEFINLVVLEAGGKKMAFRVEQVISEQEILVKGLGSQLLRVRNVGGATILGSGEVVPILNPADLLKTAAMSGPSATSLGAGPGHEARAKNVLVVDDSITSRMLLESILVAAGHNVRTAVDGQEGFSLLKSENFDLVVSDVEMPRLDGFEFTAKIRADSQLSELPVIIVTSLDSREEKERGIEVGANGYIVKTSFDQDNLLKVISRFI